MPTPISATAPGPWLLAHDVARVAALDYVIAENARSARGFLKRLPLQRPLQAIEIVELNEHTPPTAVEPMLAPLLNGRDAALMSEAGCPGVADPGAALVLAAHRAGILVEPLVGPSALLLALMACGLNGNRFAFAGYLPVDAAQRAQALRALEARSQRDRETILMIETPYRNQALFDALTATLHPATLLTVAGDVTGTAQSIVTREIVQWRLHRDPLPRVPTVFLLLGAARGGDVSAAQIRPSPPPARARAPRPPRRRRPG
ncbi:MAG TPA: SAM-dependent methyltransferase [Burkholderiaceae bacterium]|nr:SAM-dependent methyltransferase [Burkholderiaceae bacterium]